MEQEDETSFINKFGYKLYTEEPLNSFYRIRSLIIFNLKSRLWNQRSTLIALLTLILIALLFVLIPLALFGLFFTSGDFGGGGDFPEIELTTIFNLAGAFILLNPFIFVLLGILGGRIIAEDLEYNTSDVYFIRIDRLSYFIGKFGALWLSYLATFILPILLVYWFSTTQFDFPLTDLNNLILLGQALSYCLIAATFLSSLMMVISSFTDKKNYATLILIIGLFGISQVIPVFVQLLDIDSLYYLSVVDILQSLWFGLVGSPGDLGFGAFGGGPTFDINLTLSETIVIILLASFFGIIIAYNRVRNLS